MERVGLLYSGMSPARRKRSTRHRKDAADLPRRKVTDRTVGCTYAMPDGKSHRPSMFATLTRDQGASFFPDCGSFRISTLKDRSR